MQHLAIIPDGNRRWAAKNKLKSFFGHKQGLESVRSTIKVCLKKGIKYLSFYTFSLENFRRGEEEKTYLFKLLSDQFLKELPELIKQEVRVRFLGDRSYFPENVLKAVKEIEEKTKHLTKLNMNLLFCYGAQQELTQAVQKIARQVKDGELDVNQVTTETVKDSLWTSGMPDPELIIRTSKRARLSNFLLYQAAYSEFKFLDCFWPEVNEARIEECLEEYNSIQRNFGK